MHSGIGKSRTCCVAHAVQQAGHSMSEHDTACHDERSKRDTSVTTSVTGAIRNFVCNVYSYDRRNSFQ